MLEFEFMKDAQHARHWGHRELASNRSISLEHWNMRERSTVEVFITSLKLACTSFGGPIAHLARDRSDDFRVGGAHQNHARPEFFDPSVRE
jgi:hypothetical protein